MLFAYSVSQMFIRDSAPKLSKCLWYSEANVYVDKNHVIFLKYGVHQKVRSMHTANCDNDIFDGIVSSAQTF